MRSWLRRHEHGLLVRPVLALAQELHERRHGLHGPSVRAAHAGGPPTRLVPLPRPRHYDRAARRRLAALARAQETSFADGPTVREFEAALAHTFQVDEAIAVSSGTAALHTALLALGVGPGDEVLVPALTHVATAMAVLQVGATVGFVDVDPETWTMSRATVEAAVGPTTRAIVVVHLCGVPADVAEITALARGRGLAVVEDAAQAHGSRLAGQALGSLGDVGCLSFQSTKTLSTGEGGAVLVNDAEVARRARLVMNLGERTAARGPTIDDATFDPAAPLCYDELGWNHRMSALQAALGLAQLEGSGRGFAERCARLRTARATIVEAFDGHRVLRFQSAPAAAEVVSGTVFFEVQSPLQRDELARRLRLERIDVRLPYQRPLSEHAVFAAARCIGPMDVSRHICRAGLGVRIDSEFSRADVRSIVRALERAVR